jgi:AcrR family transcriptional regulator
VSNPAPPPLPKRRGGRSRLLTEDQIALAAFSLVDREGAHALTIKRLATELGVGVMTLYGYVDSKDDIIEFLPAVLLQDLPVLESDVDWQAMLEARFVTVYERLIKHANVTRLIANSPVFGLAQARLVESVLSHLTGVGIELEAAYSLHRTLSTYTIGYVLFQLAEADGDDPHVQRLSLLDPVEFSTLHRLALAPRPTRDEQFREGLRTIVRGLTRDS